MRNFKKILLVVMGIVSLVGFANGEKVENKCNSKNLTKEEKEKCQKEEEAKKNGVKKSTIEKKKKERATSSR